MPDDGPPVPVTLSGGDRFASRPILQHAFMSAPTVISCSTRPTRGSETLEKHFLNPRVSALFDDLDPTQGGSVSWKQLADRVAVSWINVPEWYGFNSTRFKRNSSSTVASLSIYWTSTRLDGLTGLSAAAGSLDFYETSLGVDSAMKRPVAVNGPRRRR